MKTFLVAYFAGLLPMLAIDVVWLTVAGKRFYPARIGHLLAEKPRLVPAGIFYLIYVLGIAGLVVVPAVNEGTGYLEVLLYGALLGLVAYGTYDLTNQATLKEWPPLVTLVDLAWGSALTGAVSVLALYFSNLIL
jgi:uncharacterized membrane protein